MFIVLIPKVHAKSFARKADRTLGTAELLGSAPDHYMVVSE